MTTPARPATAVAWPSGVGGVQCGGCWRTTVCRWFSADPEDDGEWLCAPCYYASDDDALCPHGFFPEGCGDCQDAGLLAATEPPSRAGDTPDLAPPHTGPDAPYPPKDQP